MAGIVSPVLLFLFVTNVLFCFVVIVCFFFFLFVLFCFCFVFRKSFILFNADLFPDSRGGIGDYTKSYAKLVSVLLCIKTGSGVIHLTVLLKILGERSEIKTVFKPQFQKSTVSRSGLEP